MDENQKLPENFNAKLFSEVRRKLFYKNLASIIFAGFFKGFVSVLDVFLSFSTSKNRQNKK